MNTAMKRDGRPVNTTGNSLDPLAGATGSSLDWARANQRTTILIGGLLTFLIAVIAIGYSIYAHRTAEAQTAFGEAMQVYQTPLVRPGQALPPGMKAFTSSKERATQANTLFANAAQRFNLTAPGKLALYFEGLTALEAGQNGTAEDTLKRVASGWNGDTAALGKLALAQLYSQTGRTDRAVELYQELGKGHASTVPPGLAQLQLADLYTTEGKTEDARHIYAELKDHDKDAKGKLGVAAQVASEKLNPQPAPALPAR